MTVSSLGREMGLAGKIKLWDWTGTLLGVQAYLELSCDLDWKSGKV